MIEIPGYTVSFTPAQASCRKYPLQFLCDFTYAVLDNDIGDLLEYHHLIKHPKHKDIWSQSFGKEIRRLATTTKTIFFCEQAGNPQGPPRWCHIWQNRMCLSRQQKGQIPHKEHNGTPSPGEHLGLFWREKKHQVFSPATADETWHALKLFLKLGKWCIRCRSARSMPFIGKWEIL